MSGGLGTGVDDPRGGVRSRRVPRLLLVLLVVLLVIGAEGYHIIRSARATEGVRPGQLWEKSGSLGLDYAHTLDFDLPSGQLVVQLATPVDTVPSDDAPDGLVDPGQDVRSGSEASFVPVVWHLQGEAPNVPDTPTYQFQVVLVDGSHRYDLHAGTSSQNPPTSSSPVVTSKAMTVVVAGDGGGLVVEVSYDGLTQKGYVGGNNIAPGVAAGYYSDTQKTFAPARPCTLFSTAQLAAFETLPFQCAVGAVRLLPYVPGPGWVGSPHQWFAVVEVQVRAAREIRRRGQGAYAVTHEPLRVTLDHRGPVAVLLQDDDGPVHDATYVFRTGPKPTTVQLSAAFVATRGTRTYHFGTDRVVALK